MVSYKLTLFLLFLAIFARPSVAVACTGFPFIAGCDCNAFTGDIESNVAISCGSVEVSIAEVTSELRAGGVESRVVQLSFLTFSDTLLPSNVFQGFTSLEILQINGNVLSVIEPGAFSGLSSLQVLDLRGNNLEWLSGEILTGIDTLDTLRLDNNQIQYLSSDLQPIISNISFLTVIGNMLECDCHLQWFADFVASTAGNTVHGAMCFNGMSFVPLDDPSVDFAHCQDLCTLGYNFCHEDATCIPGADIDDFSCTCNDGLTGDGIDCQDLCTLGYDFCHENATCIPGADINDFSCACNDGFMGDGIDCYVCDLPCGIDERCVFGSIQQCICDAEHVLDGDTCILREASHTVCSGETFQGYVWPNITAGTIATLECATADSASLSRECQSDGNWGVVMAPDCLSIQTRRLRGLLDLLANNSSSDPLLTDFSSQLLEISTELSFSGDIPELVDILQEAINLLENVAIPEGGEVPTSFDNLVMVGSELLEEDSHPLWQQLSDPQVADNLVGLFGAMNDLGTLILANSDEMIIIISSNNIALVVIRPFNSSDGSCSEENITISSSLLNSTSDLPSMLQLPPTILNDTLGQGFECSTVGIVAVVYDNTGGLIAQSESIAVPVDRCGVQPRQVNSVVISATIVNSSETVNSTRLSTPVIITLQHDNTTLEGPVCAFINEDELLEQQSIDGSWLTQGCGVVSRSDNETVCQCFHLTSFALLMSPRGPRTAPNLPLQIASKVGLTLSIICLIVTIILLYALKLDSKSNRIDSKSNRLHKIHRQLALALCLSQIIFLVAVDRTLVPSPDWLCTTIAALLHYFLLCTFAWQLIEGVHLYLMVVKVFYNRKVEWLYYPFAWGAPLVIVAITVGVRFCDYTSEFYCWITIVRGTIWAFLGPVIAVLVINTVIMIIIISIIVKAAKKREKNAYVFFTLIHASLVLVPILGITWILGFFVVGEGLASTIIEWLFFFFTTLQGVAIFIMHCLLKREVRSAFLKAIGCHEQAKKQRTVMDGTRRLSRVTPPTSIQQLAKNFSRRKRKTSIPDDITSFQPKQDSSGLFSETFVVARPIAVRNPLFNLNNIKEESDMSATPPSSAPSTPKPSDHNP